MRDYVTEAEARIAERQARGDVAGVVEIAFRAYAPEILGYVAALLPERELAEAQEIAGELYCRLLEHGARFEGRSTYRVWMYRIARNLALHWRDKAATQRTHALRTLDASAMAAIEKSTTAEWEKTTLKLALQREREALSEEDRSLLLLLVDRKLTSSEVAEALSTADKTVTAAAVRQRFRRLRERLHDVLRSANAAHAKKGDV